VEQEHKNKKRGRWSAVRLASYAALVALLAGFIVFILSKREPRYEDRALSVWIYDLDAGIANPGNRLAAEDAIRHMEAKSVPHLVQFLKARPSPTSM
jgi:hypothetical protein